MNVCVYICPSLSKVWLIITEYNRVTDALGGVHPTLSPFEVTVKLSLTIILDSNNNNRKYISPYRERERERGTEQRERER